MYLKNLSFFERLPNYRLYKGGNKITLLVTWGLVLILLFTVIGLMIAQADASFDDDDISLIGEDLSGWRLEHLFSLSFPLGLELGVFAAIMRLEYLKSHIGEKRSSSEAMNAICLSARNFPGRFYFYGTVFSILPAPVVDDANRLRKAFRLILIKPVSSKAYFFTEVSF